MRVVERWLSQHMHAPQVARGAAREGFTAMQQRIVIGDHDIGRLPCVSIEALGAVQDLTQAAMEISGLAVRDTVECQRRMIDEALVPLSGRLVVANYRKTIR